MPRGITAEDVLQKVAHLLAAGALPATFSLDEVIRKAPISRRKLYALFPGGRKTLLEQLVKRSWEELRRVIGTATRLGRKPANQMKVIVSEVLNILLARDERHDRLVAWVVLRRGTGLDDTPAVWREYGFLNQLVDGFLKGLCPRDRRVVAATRAALLGAFDGIIWDLVVQIRHPRDYDPGYSPDLARWIMDSLVDSVSRLCEAELQ